MIYKIKTFSGGTLVTNHFSYVLTGVLASGDGVKSVRIIKGGKYEI